MAPRRRSRTTDQRTMQIFPRELNLLALVLGALGAAGGVSAVLAVWFFLSPRVLQEGYAPTQPIEYSHRLHAGELGMDCRYCHSQVERSHEAMVPPTQTCMGCHMLVLPKSEKLAPLRASWETDQPVAWTRVHQVPDHAFFNHSAHLSAGVGCASCHGRIDQMEVVRVAEPIAMQWCLDCHRDPAKNLRPTTEITNMAWEPDEAWLAQAEQIAETLQPPEHCSGCHR